MIIADAFNTFELNLNNAVGIDDQLNNRVFRLNAYPNPFEQELNIDISLSEDSHMKIAVYDMLGNIIEILEDRYFEPGHHTLKWKAEGLPSGSYILKSVMDDQQIIERVNLVR